MGQTSSPGPFQTVISLHTMASYSLAGGTVAGKLSWRHFFGIGVRSVGTVTTSVVRSCGILF